MEIGSVIIKICRCIQPLSLPSAGEGAGCRTKVRGEAKQTSDGLTLIRLPGCQRERSQSDRTACALDGGTRL